MINLYCMTHWPLFVIDRGQSLIIPSLFDSTNYTYWKVRMRVFLQFLDEKVRQVVEIGWTKLKEEPADWDDLRLKRQTSIAEHWMLYSVRSPMRSSRRYPLQKLLRKHGLSSKQPMKGLRLSRIQSFKGLPLVLKKLRWRRMSCWWILCQAEGHSELCF